MVSESKGPWFNLPSFRRLKIGFSAFLAKFTPLFTCIHFLEPFHEEISLCPNGAFPRKYNQWDLTISTSFSFLLLWVKSLREGCCGKPHSSRAAGDCGPGCHNRDALKRRGGLRWSHPAGEPYRWERAAAAGRGSCRGAAAHRPEQVPRGFYWVTIKWQERNKRPVTKRNKCLLPTQSSGEMLCVPPWEFLMLLLTFQRILLNISRKKIFLLQ